MKLKGIAAVTDREVLGNLKVTEMVIDYGRIEGYGRMIGVLAEVVRGAVSCCREFADDCRGWIDDV